MRQVVLKLSRLLELKRIFGLCTFAKIALLETLLEEFVIAFCQKLSRWNFLWNHEELGWRRWFHEFLSGVGKDDFLSWRTRWMSISLTLLASLNPQIIRRADTWQLIKTWAQIFSDQEMDERNNAARRGIPKITFFLNNISKWHGQKSSQIYDVVESSYHKKPFFNKVISLALWKNHLKTTPDTFLLLVPQCLKITQNSLVWQHCERSEQLIYHCNWL